MMQSLGSGSLCTRDRLADGLYIETIALRMFRYQGPLLLTWIEFNPSLDK